MTYFRSDHFNEGGSTRRTERFRYFNRREKYGIKVGVPVQSPTKFELVIDLKTGDRAEVG